MSMISEQIKFLRDEADYRCHVVEDNALADTLNRAADTIEMLSAKVREPTIDKDYLISLIQEAVYDGEACGRLLDLVDRPQGEWIPLRIIVIDGKIIRKKWSNIVDIGYDLNEAYETGYEEGYRAGYEAGQRDMENHITYDVYNYEDEGMQWR